jgi:hypothetical protein
MVTTVEQRASMEAENNRIASEIAALKPIFYSLRGSRWHKSLILLDAGWRFREIVVPRYRSI